MKTVKVNILAACVMLLGISCKKSFLDITDKSVLLTENYVTDLETTGHYLNGVYTRMGEFYHGYFTSYPELVADNVKPETGNTLLLPHYHWEQQEDPVAERLINTQSQAMNGFWRTGYYLIRNCNFVLEKAEGYKAQNPSTASEYKAEAYFLRALLHFNLVNVFAQSYNFTPGGSHLGIPYAKTSDWTAVPNGRGTVAVVYNSMIEDLNNALANFTANPGKVNYANRNAAKALLARIYLYMEQYEKAKNIACEIVQQVPPMSITAGYPAQVFNIAEPSKTEVLFHLPPGSDGYYNYFGGLYYQTAITFRATTDIAQLLTESVSDVRHTWVTASTDKWTITKFPSGLVAGFPIPAGAYCHPILRSSEMCLTAAEAYSHLNMEDSARHYLDAIRLRADTTALPIIASGPSLLDSIYKERRKEFAFEGFRMFDLLRWKSGVNRTDAPPNAQHLPYPSDKAIAPVPGLDVEIYGLQQNAGY